MTQSKQGASKQHSCCLPPLWTAIRPVREIASPPSVPLTATSVFAFRDPLPKSSPCPGPIGIGILVQPVHNRTDELVFLPNRWNWRSEAQSGVFSLDAALVHNQDSHCMRTGPTGCQEMTFNRTRSVAVVCNGNVDLGPLRLRDHATGPRQRSGLCVRRRRLVRRRQTQHCNAV